MEKHQKAVDMDSELLAQCESKLGLVFSNKALLLVALTHRSFSRHSSKISVEDNERLEFLGDAVLKLVMSDYLFRRFPRALEGELTKIRAKLVSDRTLSVLSSRLGLGPFIRFSYGEKSTGGMTKISNLANVMEALLGALYLDQGLAKVQSFFESVLDPIYDELVSEESLGNYKTQLQEWMQSRRALLPVYQVVGVEGPDHAQAFNMEVTLVLDGKTMKWVGSGRSKKSAEQAVAKVALLALGIELER